MASKSRLRRLNLREAFRKMGLRQAQQQACSPLLASCSIIMSSHESWKSLLSDSGTPIDGLRFCSHNQSVSCLIATARLVRASHWRSGKQAMSRLRWEHKQLNHDGQGSERGEQNHHVMLAGATALGTLRTYNPSSNINVAPMHQGARRATRITKQPPERKSICAANLQRRPQET